ncbi:hypothetical protein D3C86_2153800 [compost metagenome]
MMTVSHNVLSLSLFGICKKSSEPFTFHIHFLASACRLLTTCGKLLERLPVVRQ